jgi:DNA-binding NarL/FixJ family response regulator
MRVVLLHEDVARRSEIRSLLGAERWVERCWQAADGHEALRILSGVTADVALLHVGADKQPPLELCQEIRRASPRTRIVIVGGSSVAARLAGATGVVPAGAEDEEMLRIVFLVGRGMSVFPRGGHAMWILSPRERNVLDLLASGHTNREIARKLSLSPYTVKEYVSSVYRKLGARNRAEAVRRAAGLEPD